MPEYIFVYGTLRKDSPQPMARLLVSHSQYIGEASIQGALYDLGRYPGVLEHQGYRTFGELFRLEEPEKILPPLDDYEECSAAYPEPTLYLRKLCPVLLEDGSTVDAWVYVYNRQVTGCTLIEEGRYLEYLEGKS